MHCNIRELRIQKVMTQQELVKAVNMPGFDVGMLSRIENGHCLPTPEAEEALKSALQATHDELFGEWKQVDVPGTGPHTSERAAEIPMAVEELVACLGKGWRNAKTRKTLAIEMDIGDRMLRRLIETAQEHGVLIGNLTDGNGYFLIDNVDDGKAYYAQEKSRAMQLLKKIDPLGRWLMMMGEKL